MRSRGWVLWILCRWSFFFFVAERRGIVRSIGLLRRWIGALVGSVALDVGREDWRSDWRARQLERMDAGDLRGSSLVFAVGGGDARRERKD